LRLRDLVSYPDKDVEGKKPFGTATIYRAQGKRLLPIGFSVRGRPLAEVQADAAKKIEPLLKKPYRLEWAD
jgi:hypothetical protein